MTPLERRKFELHAETKGFQRRLRQSCEWIDYCFECFEIPVLNYSGGKDSLVLLHLVCQQCGYDDVDIYHFDNGLLDVPGVDSFVRESVDRIGGALFVRTSERVNSEAMIREEGHGYSGFWGQYWNLARERGWDLRLIGIRAAESTQRRDRFASEQPINGNAEPPVAAPIHHLSTRDVWAYIVEHDLEYHEIYDKQGALYDDIEARGNRLVTLYDSEFDALGTREISQFIYPSETNAVKDIEQRE